MQDAAVEYSSPMFVRVVVVRLVSDLEHSVEVSRNFDGGFDTVASVTLQ